MSKISKEEEKKHCGVDKKAPVIWETSRSSKLVPRNLVSIKIKCFWFLMVYQTNNMAVSSEVLKILK